MKKVVKFLEGYVQWIALGLAALWLGYVGYAYWYQPPVHTASTPPLTPGNVDAHVNEVVTPVATIIAENRDNSPHMVIPPAGEYVALLGMRPLPETALVQFFVPQPGILIVQQQQGIAQGDKALLPDLTNLLTALGSAAGKSVVLIPPPPGAPGNAVNAVAQPGDRFWVTASFNFSTKVLDDAWANAKLPKIFRTTDILNVQLVREELVDGKWVNETPIPGLPVLGQQANVPTPTWPPAPGAEQAYEQWAAQNCADIIEPPFYEVIAGPASDPWHTYATSVPQVMDVPPPPFDPADPSMTPSTPEEKQARADYLKQKDAAERAARLAKRNAAQPPPAPTEGSTGTNTGTTSGRKGGKKGSSYIPLSIAMADEGAPPPAPRPRTFQGDPRRVSRPQPLSGQPGTVAAPTAQPGTTLPPPERDKTIPNAAFTPPDPALHDMEVWAHDETVKPGHTYRYKIKMQMKNPLYLSVNVAKNQADAAIFTLEAQSDWTKSVTVPLSRFFFVTKDGGFNQVVEVEIINWAKGLWNPSVHKVSPGDAVPETGWAVVDTKRDYIRDQIRVLMRDDHGNLINRTVKEDEQDANHRRLEALIKQQPPPAPAASANP